MFCKWSAASKSVKARSLAKLQRARVGGASAELVQPVGSEPIAENAKEGDCIGVAVAGGAFERG